VKESETTAFKKSLTELKAWIASIAAILNNHGLGDLWFWMGRRGMPLILNNAPNIQTREVSIAICKTKYFFALQYVKQITHTLFNT